MSSDDAQFYILVGEEKVALPAGLTPADWALEKIRWQNPRIRAFLGCIRLLGGVLESNYAILHCSPERLLEIWRKVRQVSELIQNRIAPLLATPSRFPGLETARQRLELSLRILDATVLSELDRLPLKVAQTRLLDVRKLLCVSIGKIHAFLQDAFGELMANDPRSSHDADYFLSRRFPQDIEEAEWLYSTVERLQKYLGGLEVQRQRRLATPADDIGRCKRLPASADWEPICTFLDIVSERLTPKLKEVLALRGIRFSEMEILDRYAAEIPAQCIVLRELYRSGCQMVERLDPGDSTPGESTPGDAERGALECCHEVLSHRMSGLMRRIDRELRDLSAFTPIWLDSIGKRRALLLKRIADDDGERAAEGKDPAYSTEEIASL